MSPGVNAAMLPGNWAGVPGAPKGLLGREQHSSILLISTDGTRDLSLAQTRP